MGYAAEPPLSMNINGAMKVGLVPIGRSAVVNNGVATFYLTTDNTASGPALFSAIEVVMFRGIEPDSPISTGEVSYSSDMKVMTVPIKKSSSVSTLPLLGALTSALLSSPTAANGSTVYAFIVGDAA